MRNNDNNNKIALVLTPTRELAVQVAGVAKSLYPSPSRRNSNSNDDDDDNSPVRLVTRPTNLMQNNADQHVRVYVGSAKALHQSLYGDASSMPAPPTSKPEAMALLQRVDWIVLDEVDRLLGVAGKQPQHKRSQSKQHEKPAAVLLAAVARLTLGRAVTIGASATVGRPLRRELARCLGLPPNEGPIVVRAVDDDEAPPPEATTTTTRAVTIPDTVRHGVVPVVDGASPGKILTQAFAVVQALSDNSQKKILLVLTRNFGIGTSNAIGALQHFNCRPAPVDLLDALEAGLVGLDSDSDNDDRSTTTQQSQQLGGGAEGYLLVTGEDTVRGLHLDGLDCVVVAGRPHGPDEYTHICGRTGRQGARGTCLNIVSAVDADKLRAWESMLGVPFVHCATVEQCVEFVGKDDNMAR